MTATNNTDAANVKYATTFIQELSMFFGPEEMEEMTPALILDALACAGLRLVPDEDGQSSHAFMTMVSVSPKD